MKKITFVILSLCLVIIAGCNNNQGGGMNAKGLQRATVNMADNETVQKAFSEGRVRVMQEDQAARRGILDNVLQEQGMILQDEGLRSQFIALNTQTNEWMTKSSQGMEQLMDSSLKINEAIMRNPELKMKFLRQNIKSFHAIAAAPELRSQMADAMLLLLKDPKIKQELDKMIKMAVAKEMQAMMKQMKQMQAHMKMQRNIQPKQQQVSPSPQTQQSGTE